MELSSHKDPACILPKACIFPDVCFPANKFLNHTRHPLPDDESIKPGPVRVKHLAKRVVLYSAHLVLLVSPPLRPSP